jgi:hypothetical protein
MFARDSRAEGFLTQMGVRWKYSNSVRFNDLEPAWRTHNAARPVPVRQEAVLEYATLMESGSAAPAPILSRHDSRLHVLDGVQRLSAAELQSCTILSAYLVETDSEDLEAAIRVLANARLQGRAEPAEWSRRRAVEVLIVDRGMSSSEVAKMGGWNASILDGIATAVRLQRQVECAGGPVLPDTMLSVIGSHIPARHLEKFAQPISEFLWMLKKSQLSSADAEPYVTDFFAPVSDKSKVFSHYKARLDDLLEDPELCARIHGRKAGPLPKDIALLRSLKSALTIAQELPGDVPNVDEFFRLLRRIHEELKSRSRRSSGR